MDSDKNNNQIIWFSISPQAFEALLLILANINNVVVKMVLIHYHYYIFLEFFTPA